MRKSWTKQRPVSTSNNVRQIFKPDLARKISIAITTLPENLIRINQTLIEKFQADSDYLFSTRS